MTSLDTMFIEFIDKHKLDNSFKQHAQKWFIPLAENLAAHQNEAGRPFFVGVNGCQGSGKSTLTDFLTAYLHSIHGLHVANLSLDDFYLTHSERLSLSIKIHPLLATRGVPGTHDVEMLSKCFDELANQHTHIEIPRFNKAIDDRAEPASWTKISEPVDIILMEGWCWGSSAQHTEQLTQPINLLEQTQDETGVWRQYVNRQLHSDYDPLYKRMDYWVMLKAPSFQTVFNWRLQQEQKLKASKAHLPVDSEERKGIMNQQQIEHFIQHYQRLTEHSLESLAQTCDVVFELDENRQIKAVRRKR